MQRKGNQEIQNQWYWLQYLLLKKRIQVTKEGRVNAPTTVMPHLKALSQKTISLRRLICLCRVMMEGIGKGDRHRFGQRRLTEVDGSGKHKRQKMSIERKN